ncbi:MAG: 8-amino-7-oxononanoate synthase [Chromatiales bacterium]|nr:8-amino-7-oxononanoate synthase [Chromatiales bacterium]
MRTWPCSVAWVCARNGFNRRWRPEPLACESLRADLERLSEQQLYRRRRVRESATEPQARVDGRELLSFCSNDYLGLANHPRVVQALAEGARRWGAGSGAAHLISGHCAAHHALEEELAEFTGRPRALLFSTGYMANLGVIGALTGRGDSVFEDRLNHASLLDGGLVSGAGFVRYRHADAADLAKRLDSVTGRRLVVTDGVFSMDGDLAPLPELANLDKTWLMVDDAHGFGVMGREGRGTPSHFGLAVDQVPIFMATLGKALGTFGAFVAGEDALIETLIQRARAYIYTTAPPPAMAEASRAALRVLQEEPWRRESLFALVARFREGARQLGLPLASSPTPIQPLLVGDAGQALAAARALEARGILVTAIRPPTVPAGTARLRVTFSAAHTQAQVDRLLDALGVVFQELPEA